METLDINLTAEALQAQESADAWASDPTQPSDPHTV
jgi:hypothetical protein